MIVSKQNVAARKRSNKDRTDFIMQTEKKNKQKRTVLVVEDNEINSLMLSEILMEKYTVLTARNGQEGLDLIRKHETHISAIMLDLEMPVMNGYEFLRIKREDPELSEIPVIVETVANRAQDEVHCLELGAMDFISKPYNPRLILMRVDNLIRLRESDWLISELARDALTGFKNRMTYYHDIERLEAEAQDNPSPAGIVFADINGLKSTNDLLGHVAGDKVITDVAEILTKVFPDAGKYRIGGDEFVVVSFEDSEENFNQKLHTLENMWSKDCSASIGSIWLETLQDVEKNVAIADQKMYCNKSLYYEKKRSDQRYGSNVESEEILKQLEQVADHLPSGFFIYHANESEEMIFFNSELVKMFGCDNDEEFRQLIGNSFRGIVHREELNQIENDISDQIKKENDIGCVKYRIVRKDGTEKLVLGYGTFVHTEIYGDVYYVFLNDITRLSP